LISDNFLINFNEPNYLHVTSSVMADVAARAAILALSYKARLLRSMNSKGKK
jgi:hypothetical protein